MSGIPVQAVEFTGDPGDVIFMHPWIIHTASPNRSSRPRIVITERVPRLDGQDGQNGPAGQDKQNDDNRIANSPEEA